MLLRAVLVCAPRATRSSSRLLSALPVRLHSSHFMNRIPSVPIFNSVSAFQIPTVFRCRAFASSAPTHYDMLGVAPTASAKEIKSAYFRKAKLLHPDMNPGDTQAKYKFHKISDAYEVLSDEAKRANYDSELMRRSSQSKYSQSTYSSDSTSTTSQSNQSTNQSTNQWSNQSTRTQYDEYNTQPPNDPFQNQSIFQDFDIITEAMKSFVSDLKDECVEAFHALRRGHFADFFRILRDNALDVVILGSMVVPVVLLFRSPAIGMLIARAVWSQFSHHPQATTVFFASLWKGMVRMAAARRRRKR